MLRLAPSPICTGINPGKTGLRVARGQPGVRSRAHRLQSVKHDVPALIDVCKFHGCLSAPRAGCLALACAALAL